jgi:hypothetical protein
MKPLAKLRHTGGLIVTGIPFERGTLFPSDGLRAAAPLWWDIRSLWPDGSVKWLMLHARKEGPGELEIFKGGERPEPVRLDGGKLALDVCVLSFTNGLWRFETPAEAWELIDDVTDMGGLQPGGKWNAQLLEASPVAPLLLLSRPGELAVEWLLRLDVKCFALHAARRVSACKDGTFGLRSSQIRLALSGAVRFPRQRLDAQGLDDLAVEQNGCGVHLKEAGPRRPARMSAGGNEVTVSLWPEDAGEWPVMGGTSFRHELRVYTKGLSPLAEVSFEPGYLARTGVLSPCYIAGEDPDRLLFPGFELGYIRLLDTGSLEEIKDDPAHFGLFHWGDWPLRPGQYGADGRCYSDNEYDTAFAYFQGYAAFGDREYLQTARRCAVHTADVDFNCNSGDMRYHGYSEEAENHAERRTIKGDMGHWWSDGLWLAWFLYGDPWCRGAALALTEHICGRFPDHDAPFRREWTICERSLGWPLVVLASACEAEPNPASYALSERICAYIARFARNPDAEYEGEFIDEEGPVVWWRAAMKDGCKPFMLGVAMEGLERFHRLTGNADAASALTALARYIAEKAWKPWRADFTYEINAYGRGHRDINAQYLTPLFLRGLGYAYELTGDESLRDIAMRAFHACLWTLHSPGANGKDIALVCRSLGAFAAMAGRWAEEDERTEIASLPKSSGKPYEIESRESGRYDLPGAYADEGSFALEASFAPGSSDYLNLRALLHIDGGPGGCAVSVVTFYDYFVVRMFGGSGMLIETLDGALSTCVPGGWKEGETHAVEVRWRAPGGAEFLVDGAVVDRRALPRPLSGGFTRLFVGEKPGGWTVKGEARLVRLSLGPGASGPFHDETTGEKES